MMSNVRSEQVCAVSSNRRSRQGRLAMDEAGFIHGNGGCASTSHVFCPTWPTGAAPSGGRRVSESSSSSRPRPPTPSPSFRPVPPSQQCNLVSRRFPASTSCPRSISFSSFHLQSALLSTFPPPVYAFPHLRLPSFNRPPSHFVSSLLPFHIPRHLRILPACRAL
jgi:hypothetical protein